MRNFFSNPLNSVMSLPFKGVPAISATVAVISLASFAGLVLSILSILQVCNTACTETAEYTIFGMSFGWFGVVYFNALLVTIALRDHFPWGRKIVEFYIFAAAGAEVKFIWIQKYVIGKWCPICLTIAAIIFLMAVVVLVNRGAMLSSRRVPMKRFLKEAIFLVTAIILGATGAGLGVKNNAEAAELNLFLGKSNSNTVVYIISDWFCPACRRTEPEIENMYPELAKVAKVAFVDVPVHPETTNFTPYNTQFLLYEKAKYIQLRKALNSVAKETKTPSPDDIQKAIAPYGVRLRVMNYVDIQSGMEWNEEVFRTYRIKATPTVVVTNAKSGKHISLVGEKEISYPAILAAMKNVEK